MKQANVLLITSCMLGMSISGAQASITFEDYYLDYRVWANSTYATGAPDTVQDFTPTIIQTGDFLSLPKVEKIAGTPGAAITSQVNDTASGTSSGFGITMKTGATGNFVSNATSIGTSVSGWQSFETTEELSGTPINGAPSPLGLQPNSGLVDQAQWLRAFNGLVFTVDTPEHFILTAESLGAFINVSDYASGAAPGGSVPENLVDYNWMAQVKLEALVYAGSISPLNFLRTDLVAQLDLDLTNPGDVMAKNVSLKDQVGDEIYLYRLTSLIDLDTTIFNKSMFGGDYFGEIPAGTFGAMGTEDNPFLISGTISNVPVPGAVVLFATAMLGLFGVSRRRNVSFS